MSYIVDLLPFAPIFVLVAALVYLAVFVAFKKKREKPGLLTIIAEYSLYNVISLEVQCLVIYGLNAAIFMARYS